MFAGVVGAAIHFAVQPGSARVSGGRAGRR
jgi:hypothetical protein